MADAPTLPGALAQLFAPLLVKGADAGANYLVDHQVQIVSGLRSIEGDAVTFLENELLGAIPKQSLGEKMASGEFAATVRNLATEIAAQLPAADEVLIDTIEQQLAALAAKLAT